MDASNKAEEYLKYGHWPGKKVKLTSKQWENQVRHVLYYMKDIFKNLAGFVPIRNLINVEIEILQLIMSPADVIFPKGISHDTHCHLVFENFVPLKPGSEFVKNNFLKHAILITRKMEWIGWIDNFALEITFDYKGKPIFKKYTSLRSEFLIINLETAIKWDASFGRHFIEHVHFWLAGDIYREQERVRQKERVLSEVNGIVERIKFAVDF